MREIKFRFWSKILKAIVTPHDSILRGAFNDPEFVVMQYTGLKDKNGKEIYEGDIIAHWDNRYVVPNFTPLDRSYTADNVLEYHDGSDDWISMSNVDWEVVGNIYENPELSLN